MKALVYAHYSRTNSMSEYVLRAIECYRRYVQTIIFVSASPLPRTVRDQLNKHCAAVIERHNTGYDFASWKAGIDALDVPAQFEQIILTNDSVIGPLGDPSRMFDKLLSDPRDVCGLTLSWESRRHVQSYFVRFGRATLSSGAFEEFWREIEGLENKEDIIARYEIGLTAYMEIRGHTVGALFEPPSRLSTGKRVSIWARAASVRAPHEAYLRLRKINRLPHLNPTHYLWREILDAGIPFLKKELIRDNPRLEAVNKIVLEAKRRYGVDPAELESFAHA